MRVWDGVAGGARRCSSSKAVLAVGWRYVSDKVLLARDGGAGAAIASVALARRAGEVGVFAVVGASLARLSRCATGARRGGAGAPRGVMRARISGATE